MDNKTEQLNFVMNLLSSIETEWISQQITFAFSDPKNMLQSVGISFNNSLINSDQLALTKVIYFSLFSKIILSNNVNSILKKGFVLIEQDEKIIKRKTELKIDRGLELKFYDGNVSLNK